MKMNAYAVFDAKLAVFGMPWFQATDAGAIRVFSDAVNDGSNPNNQWHKHPEDFSLYHVGAYDDEFGALLPETPVSLVTASALFSAYKVNFDENDFFDKNGLKKVDLKK